MLSLIENATQCSCPTFKFPASTKQYLMSDPLNIVFTMSTMEVSFHKYRSWNVSDHIVFQFS